MRDRTIAERRSVGLSFWDVLDKGYLERLAARVQATPQQDPWAWIAREILQLPDADQEQHFLKRVTPMLSTGSAKERRELAGTIAHYLGADLERLIAYLKANGAMWKGLPKDA
jgi:hypothetical protein